MRIGTQIPIGNNLYSLLYIACLQQEALAGWSTSITAKVLNKAEGLIDGAGEMIVD